MFRLLNIFTDPVGSILQFFAFILLFLAPISSFVNLVLVLVALDLLTGSYAAVKAGEKFSAKKLRNTVDKFIFYSVAIVAGFLVQKIFNSGTDLPRIAALFIGSIETKSIYENISKITGIDILTNLWEIMKTKIQSYIDTLKSK